MKLPWLKSRSAPLDGQIERISKEMNEVRVDSNEYRKLIVRLDRLYRMKTLERREPVSRDMLIQVAGNLLGILTIVVFETRGTITSKALTELFKVRRS